MHGVSVIGRHAHGRMGDFMEDFAGYIQIVVGAVFLGLTVFEVAGGKAYGKCNSVTREENATR